MGILTRQIANSSQSLATSAILLVMPLLAGSCGDSPKAAPASLSFARSLPPDFQRGVNHAHIHRRGHGYGSAVSAEELAELKKLGVNWIAIMPFGYQASAETSELVGPRDLTLTDKNLADEIAAAHRLGIRVTLKPHIWSHDFWDGKEWSGTIRQESAAEHARWWKAYREIALHFAGHAEAEKADAYCIGTELVGMTANHQAEWRELIADIRQIYRGPLTYAAHWEKEFDRVEFWDALDFIGVSAYFPLDTPEGASVEQLVAAWQPHRQRIAKLQSKFMKPVLFMEVGYRAVADCHRQPWLYSGGRPDAQAQARAYEAVFRAFAGESWWQGAYFWKTYSDPARAAVGDEDTDFCFRGHPAESVVGKWYGGLPQQDAR